VSATKVVGTEPRDLSAAVRRVLERLAERLDVAVDSDEAERERILIEVANELDAILEAAA
jgi:hypothetical protein